jgi:hypothetical protein
VRGEERARVLSNAKYSYLPQRGAKPAACLYAPEGAVNISGILEDAAADLGIPTKPDLELRFPSFWINYAGCERRKKGRTAI